MSNDEIKDLFETLGVTRRYIGYLYKFLLKASTHKLCCVNENGKTVENGRLHR